MELYDRAHERIERSPAVMRGEPVIRGTRLPVRTLHARIKGGEAIEDLLADYPASTEKRSKRPSSTPKPIRRAAALPSRRRMASPPDPPTLRLLIDACVTPAVVSHLNAAFGRAVDALHVDTVLPPATADRAVLAWASQDVRIVVTSNIADFSLLARRAKGHPGLVLVEDQNTKGVQVAAVTQVLERYWRGGPPMAIRLGTCSPGEGREVGGWRFEGFHRGDVGAQRAAHSLVQNCPYFACLTSGVHSNPARALGIGIVSLNPVNPRIFGAAVMCGGTYGGRGVTIFDGGELSGRIPTR